MALIVPYKELWQKAMESHEIEIKEKPKPRFLVEDKVYALSLPDLNIFDVPLLKWGLQHQREYLRSYDYIGKPISILTMQTLDIEFHTLALQPHEINRIHHRLRAVKERASIAFIKGELKTELRIDEYDRDGWQTGLVFDNVWFTNTEYEMDLDATLTKIQGRIDTRNMLPPQASKKFLSNPNLMLEDKS